uniref:Uncharacterized protein n=1 Tax=Geladintestivirus 5 TaxID=3233137 RepID=A0AAU8MJT9_9CAUD
MPIFQDYYILISRTDTSHKEQVIMTYITEEEEQKLDEGKELILKRGNASFQIHGNNVYCYGEVDFHKGSDDCKQIATFNFLDYLGWKGIVIPSDYDYDLHECHSPLKCYRWTETWKPDVLVRYVHGCLNKPKRIVLFRKLL